MPILTSENKPIGVSVPNASASTSTAQKQLIIADAAARGRQFVRWNQVTNVLANRRSERVWTYFDVLAAATKLYNLRLLMGFDEGPLRDGSPTADSWDCTDKMALTAISTADKAAYVTVCKDAVKRLRDTHGFDINNEVIFTLKNEIDNDTFNGGSDGEIPAIHAEMCTRLAYELKSEFPGIKLAAPSLSYYTVSSRSWDVVGDPWFNVYSSGSIDEYWNLVDYLDLHFYVNHDSVIPPPGPLEVQQMALDMLHCFWWFLETYVTDSGRLLSLPLIISEAGRSYEDGQNTNNWNVGGQATRARLLSHLINTLLHQPEVYMVSVFNAQNLDAAYDSRTSASNHGERLYTAADALGDATDSVLTMSRLAAVEFAEAGVTAAEPS